MSEKKLGKSRMTTQYAIKFMLKGLISTANFIIRNNDHILLTEVFTNRTVQVQRGHK